MYKIQSKIGGRDENQDFYDTAQTHYGELIVVCDGMGGHNGGRHAAETAVQVIIEEVSNSSEDNPVNAVSEAISKANATIWQESQTDKSLKGMGTTVVALLIAAEKAISFHAGDSRIYQLRDGVILFRTFDHSHVFEMVKAGLIDEEQARISVKSNIITRSVGISPNVDIEIKDNLPYKKGDRFMLCTDGICGAVEENELVIMASKNENLELVLNQLVEKIDAIGFENGGKHDNLTAALIEMETDSAEKKDDEKDIDNNTEPLKPKSKRLIYLLLIILLGSLLLNLSFFLSKKKEDRKVDENKIDVNTTKINPQTPDSINVIIQSENENN